MLSVAKSTKLIGFSLSKKYMGFVKETLESNLNLSYSGFLASPY
jgi:hypothetical protein